jgi:type II secretory pathway pseudopilin PulG
MRNKNNKGFGIAEIVVAVAIIALSIFGLLSVASVSLKTLRNNTANIQAAFLLEEGVEAVKILRDSGWSVNIVPLGAETNYYLAFNGATWKATTTNAFIDNLYERKFSVNEINRDGNDDIAASGILDPNTKKITVFVSWLSNNGTTTKSISTYITKLF